MQQTLERLLEEPGAPVAAAPAPPADQRPPDAPADTPPLPVATPGRRDGCVRAVGGGGGLVLDVRSWFGDPAPDVARALLLLPDRSHLAVTCESWQVADRLRAWLPDMSVAYSVRSERQLRRYLGGRMDGSIPETPVTVRHTLLHSPREVASLRRHAGAVTVWTVDDVDRAIELSAWGVDGLVSTRLTVRNAGWPATLGPHPGPHS